MLVLLVGCSGPLVAANGPDAGSDLAVHAHWAVVGTQTTNAHRYNQSATVLSDGRVLVAGGEAWDLSASSSPGTGTVRAGAETFDPATRVWTPTGSLRIARGSHRATLLADGRVLVTGGENVPHSSWTALDSAEIYDPSNATWRLTTPMTRSRMNHAQVLLADGRVLVAGGTRGADRVPVVDEYLATVEVFDPATETWTTWASLSEIEPRADALRLGDGRVLITGLFHAEIYDPSIGSQPPPPPASPYSAPRPYQPQQEVTCGEPGVGHATGLETGSAHILSLQMSFVVDPTDPVNCRSLLGPPAVMTGPLASVALPNGLVLFTFGTRDASLLDPETGVFTSIAPRIYPRGRSHLLLLHDGRVLVTGGDDVPSEILEWR